MLKPMLMADTKTLTLTKLAIKVGIKKRTLYNMIRDGRFAVDPIPLTKPRLWDEATIDAWMRGE